jgi:hypothetical protein
MTDGQRFIFTDNCCPWRNCPSCPSCPAYPACPLSVEPTRPENLFLFFSCLFNRRKDTKSICLFLYEYMKTNF